VGEAGDLKEASKHFQPQMNANERKWDFPRGLALGASATALASGVFGSGPLNGWTVTKDNEEVCSDPDVDTAAKEIECD
jgi:hypothetical protein